MIQGRKLNNHLKNKKNKESESLIQNDEIFLQEAMGIVCS